MAEYAVSRDGYAISSVPVHLQTEKMVCQAAADTYNSALQLKSIRYDLRTEKAYLAGMDKNVPESFLNIPPDKRSAEICLQAENWYYAQKRLRSGYYVSLGSWGGCLVAAFDHPVVNDGGLQPAHPGQFVRRF